MRAYEYAMTIQNAVSNTNEMQRWRNSKYKHRPVYAIVLHHQSISISLDMVVAFRRICELVVSCAVDGVHE